MFRFSLWLLVFLIFVMILIGGLTRLTGSGLSIVEWQPIMGIFPPLNEFDWSFLFQKYQTSPEYNKINAGMTLAEFKNIFWLEYIHRVWGRLLGIVLAIPLCLSFMRSGLNPYRLPLLVLALVIGAQGFMGWYMVQSGLVDNPHVSPYRLTAHLFLGVLILGTSFWIALKNTCPDGGFSGFSKHAIKKISLSSFLLMGCVLLTLLYGGLVAGHKAGLIYNTYPLMGGQLLPSEIFFLEPIWKNLIDNPATVQLIHRWLGTLTATFAVTLCLYFWNSDIPNKIKALFYFIFFMSVLQFSLGLFTLLHMVPTYLALMHQGGALILFLLTLALILKTSAIWKQ